MGDYVTFSSFQFRFPVTVEKDNISILCYIVEFHPSISVETLLIPTPHFLGVLIKTRESYASKPLM